MKNNELEKAVQAELSRAGTTMESVLLATQGQPPVSQKKAKAPVQVPAALGKAIDTIKEKWNSVVIDTARKLTTKETKALLEEAGALSKTRLAVSKREAVIKENLINHMNALPEAAEAPRDAKGNAILAKPGEPFVIEIEGFKMTQTYVSGSVNVSVSALEELIETGELSKHQFWQLTNKVESREFDPEKALEMIRKNPELLATIKKATEVAPPRSSLKFG